MDESPDNRCHPSELDVADVESAIARIAQRNAELSREAADVFESLTWGEGPQMLRQAGVQTWLWYVIPTKYLTDEDGYMGALAEAAAQLFDELGLLRYAAICRSDTTIGVHAAFDVSDSDGRGAMAKAMQASGIQPPDLDDFVWGDIMGWAESSARSAVEDALEAAIASGDLRVGGRGWRPRQALIAAAALDDDHPEQPGQSWRTMVVTERIETWVGAATHQSPSLGAMRSRVANQLLHPIEPPDDVAKMVEPITWFLGAFGGEQPLTSAGYMPPGLVKQLHATAPWDDPYPSAQPPRSEGDTHILHGLRAWLQSAGALRKYNKRLLRTKLGGAVTDDPAAAWELLVANLGQAPWGRFVIETCAMVLMDEAADLNIDTLFVSVAAIAGDFGWSSSDDTERSGPGTRAVATEFYHFLTILEICGMVVQSGDWNDRRVALTHSGVTTVAAAARTSATGPRTSPW